MNHSLIQFSSSFLIIFPPTLFYLPLSLHLAEFFLCPSFYFSGYLYFHFSLSLSPLYFPLSSFSSSTQPIWFDVWYFLFHLAQTNKAKAERENKREREKSKAIISLLCLSLSDHPPPFSSPPLPNPTAPLPPPLPPLSSGTSMNKDWWGKQLIQWIYFCFLAIRDIIEFPLSLSLSVITVIALWEGEGETQFYA